MRPMSTLSLPRATGTCFVLLCLVFAVTATMHSPARAGEDTSGLAFDALKKGAMRNLTSMVGGAIVDAVAPRILGALGLDFLVPKKQQHTRVDYGRIGNIVTEQLKRYHHVVDKAQVGQILKNEAANLRNVQDGAILDQAQRHNKRDRIYASLNVLRTQAKVRLQKPEFAFEAAPLLASVNELILLLESELAADRRLDGTTDYRRLIVTARDMIREYAELKPKLLDSRMAMLTCKDHRVFDPASRITLTDNMASSGTDYCTPTLNLIREKFKAKELPRINYPPFYVDSRARPAHWRTGISGFYLSYPPDSRLYSCTGGTRIPCRDEMGYCVKPEMIDGRACYTGVGKDCSPFSLACNSAACKDKGSVSAKCVEYWTQTKSYIHDVLHASVTETTRLLDESITHLQAIQSAAYKAQILYSEPGGEQGRDWNFVNRWHVKNMSGGRILIGANFLPPRPGETETGGAALAVEHGETIAGPISTDATWWNISHPEDGCDDSALPRVYINQSGAQCLRQVYANFQVSEGETVEIRSKDRAGTTHLVTHYARDLPYPLRIQHKTGGAGGILPQAGDTNAKGITLTSCVERCRTNAKCGIARYYVQSQECILGKTRGRADETRNRDAATGKPMDPPRVISWSKDTAIKFYVLNKPQ
ncbi:MAG: hypothetical protein ACI9MR_004547 [Myxococcota bacterium]|jgi:hypothetical protein